MEKGFNRLNPREYIVEVSRSGRARLAGRGKGAYTQAITLVIFVPVIAALGTCEAVLHKSRRKVVHLRSQLRNTVELGYYSIGWLVGGHGVLSCS